MLLTEHHLEVFLKASPAIMDQAINELLLEDDQFDVSLFQEFIKDFRDTGGNLMEILGRTHKPVSVEEFVTSKSFLGLDIVRNLDDPDPNAPKQGVYEKVVVAASEIVAGGFAEALLLGAIGIGKTTLAQIVTLYDLYNLSTYKYPQLMLNMLPGSPMLMVCLNLTDNLAKRVTYGKLRNIVERCNYFKTSFPFDKRQKDMLSFPHNIRIMYAAANADKLLGEDVLGGIVDELNFMAYVEKSKKAKNDTGEYDQARAIYRSLVKRRASRFMNSKIGRFMLVSSKGYAGDFTDLRKQEIEASPEEFKGKYYIWEHAHWEVKPQPSLLTGPQFRVQVGDERAATRVLGEHEVARENAEVIDVPMVYQETFIADPEGSLRDWAGRSAISSNTFFKSREDVWNMGKAWVKLGMSSPFQQDFILFDDGMPDLTEDYKAPFPECDRTVHVDLGLTNDSCAIACGFTLDTVPVKKTIEREGKLVIITENMPYIVYDFALTVKPPMSGHLEIAVVRQWIYFLRDELGIPIKSVTMDNFQSVDSRQTLARRGFKTGHVTVEDLAAYDDFRTALHQKRCACREHQIGFTELIKLVPDYKKQKIDHLPNFSKDTADALCGVYRTLSGQRVSWDEKLAGGSGRGSRPARGENSRRS